MKATLEDWVVGKKWGEKPFKLTRLNENGKYYYGITSDEEQVGPFLFEEIEPIPLTPEILEKNGFVIKKKWAQIGNFGNSPLIMWHFVDDPVLKNYKHELEVHQNDTGKVHVRIPCEYVHELQHALKLCRIDTKIEL